MKFDKELCSDAVRSMVEIVSTKASRFKNKIEREELIQESYVILCNNKDMIINRFNSNVLAFCRYGLKKHLLNYIRKEKKDLSFITCSINGSEINQSDVEGIIWNKGVFSDMMLKIDLHDSLTMDKISKNLKPIEEKFLILHYVNGYNCRETAKIIGVVPQRLTKVKKDTLEKIRKVFQKDESKENEV